MQLMFTGVVDISFRDWTDMFRRMFGLFGYLNVGRITTSSQADMVAFQTDDLEEFCAAKRFMR